MLVSKLYLLSYNLLQCIGWSLALASLLRHLFITKSIHGAYSASGDLICFLQTAAILEVFHASVGLVPSRVGITLMQVGGKIHWLLFIVRQLAEVQEHQSVFITFIAWSISEVFGAVGASLAVAGRGRDVAEAKYSQWARMRKDLERMRPPLVTELLLSNDGDRILEGSVTNFFVVCKAEYGEPNDSTYNFDKESSFELQTAPTSDGVLPGVMRQIVIEVCSSLGIPVREVSPSWSDRELWKEAFITSGLRLMQHVESVQASIPCKDFHLKSWNEVSWEVKRFEGIGLVTSQIQVEILSRIGSDGYPVSKIC